MLARIAHCLGKEIRMLSSYSFPKSKYEYKMNMNMSVSFSKDDRVMGNVFLIDTFIDSVK